MGWGAIYLTIASNSCSWLHLRSHWVSWFDFLRPPRFQWIAENVAGAFVSWRQGLEKPWKIHHWRCSKVGWWLMCIAGSAKHTCFATFVFVWLHTYVSSCNVRLFWAKDIKNVEGLGALAIIGKFHFDRSQSWPGATCPRCCNIAGTITETLNYKKITELLASI